MKFTDRREFLYDPDVFKRSDTQTALRIHDEYIRRHAGKPYARFYEVDRQNTAIDPLWNQPVNARTQFSRVLEVPSIVQFAKLNWALMRQGRIPQQQVKIWTSNLVLQLLDYFPLQGDLVYWNGYRTEITHVEFEPNSYWQQTNVWLGIVYVTQIVPDGDMRPLGDPSQPAGTEIAPGAQQPFEVTMADKSKLAGNPIPGTKYSQPLLAPDPVIGGSEKRSA
jgi:hypothetical protein